MNYKNLLKELLDNFFYVDNDGHIQYSYNEGITIGEYNKELEEKLMPIISNE